MARGTGAQRLITLDVHSRSTIDAPRAEHVSNKDDYTDDDDDGDDDHISDSGIECRLRIAFSELDLSS